MLRQVLQFELVDDDVGGLLAWSCHHVTTSVAENAPPGTSLVTLSARIYYAEYQGDTSWRGSWDTRWDDSGTNISYHIVDGDPQHAFSIDHTTVS